MLILELAIGRQLRTDVVSACRSVREEYTALGWLILGGVLLILSYYLVLTGWVLWFFISWLGGAQTTFAPFTAGWLPIGYFVIATVITGGVVVMGVRGGIERMAKVGATGAGSGGRVCWHVCSSGFRTVYPARLRLGPISSRSERNSGGWIPSFGT